MKQSPERHFGIVKFFDAQKNNFGFIEHICSESGKIEPAAYVHGRQLINPANLYDDGIPVTFTLQKNHKGYAAYSVEIIKNTSISIQVQALKCFDNSSFLNCLKFLIETKNFTPLPEDRSFIVERLKMINTEDAWNLISKFDSDKYHEHLKNRIAELDDAGKIQLYQKHDQDDLLQEIVVHWNFDRNESTLALIELLRTKHTIIRPPRSFYLQLKERIDLLPLAYQLNLAKAFSDDELANKIINTQTFESVEDFLFIGRWIQTHYQGQGLQDKLVIFVHSIKRQIQAIPDSVRLEFLRKFTRSSILFDIINHWKFESIEQTEALLSILQERKLPPEELSKFEENLALNIDIHDTQEFKLWRVYFPELPALIYPRLIELLPTRPINKQFEWASLFPKDDLFIQLLVNFEYKDYEKFKSVVNFLLKPDNEVWRKRIVSSIGINHLDSGERATLAFWATILQPGYIPPSEEINNFLDNHSPYLQLLFIKHIFYYYNKDMYPSLHMMSYLESLNLTEMSALLVRAFLKYAESPLEELKMELQAVFSNTLQDEVEDLQKIKMIVKSCNGRTQLPGLHYDEYIQCYAFRGNEANKTYSPEDIFCEGRFWRSNQKYDKDNHIYVQVADYWCRGDVCIEPNYAADMTLPPEEWTLNEMMEALQIRHSQRESYISLIAGWANRMNEIMSRLKCRECGSVLRPEPFEPRRLGFYAVPLFKCANQDCTNYEETIRLTHCLNGNCYGDNNRIIDSRDCPQCEENWLVCQDCHSCCPTHHDDKVLSCPSCGTMMKKRGNDWVCANTNCQNRIKDGKLADLKKFWKRGVNHSDKWVENR
ncbi:MAG: hypothetical protein KDH97_00625 [Calditrichaeota bacterium]|nr:hypothetical protein [Calditrichota bacterium]